MKGVTQTPAGLRLRHPDPGRGARAGCLLFVLLPALAYGAWATATGSLAIGLPLLGVSLLLSVALALSGSPSHYTLTDRELILHRRNLFVFGATQEVPRTQLTDLWLSVDPLRAIVYVRYRPDFGDAVPWDYALPLFQGPWDDAHRVADSIAKQLGLPWRMVVVVRPDLSVPKLMQDVRDRMRVARELSAADKEAGRRLLRINRFQSLFQSLTLETIWVFDPKLGVVACQTLTREQEEARYPLQEIELRVEAQTEGEQIGSDDDAEYSYCYRVELVLDSGSAFTLARYQSHERTKTKTSKARQDARWTAQTLRERILPESRGQKD
jgi:hypothetical protein